MEEIKWPKNLIAEAEAWTECEPEPDDPVADGEKVIGEVPENLRKFRGYYVHYLGDQMMKKAAEHEKAHEDPAHDPRSCEKFSEEISEIKENRDLLSKIFWRSLRECMGITAGSIGLRKGWKVVECPEELESRIIHATVLMV